MTTYQMATLLVTFTAGYGVALIAVGVLDILIEKLKAIR